MIYNQFQKIAMIFQILIILKVQRIKLQRNLNFNKKDVKINKKEKVKQNKLNF